MTTAKEQPLWEEDEMQVAPDPEMVGLHETMSVYERDVRDQVFKNAKLKLRAGAALHHPGAQVLKVEERGQIGAKVVYIEVRVPDQLQRGL